MFLWASTGTILLCTLMFYGPSMSIQNFLQCSIVFHGFPECSIMFHDIPQYSMAFWDIPQHSLVFQNVPQCSMALGSVWSKLEALMVRTLRVWTVAVQGLGLWLCMGPCGSMYISWWVCMGLHGSWCIHVYSYVTMCIFLMCIHSFGGFRDFCAHFICFKFVLRECSHGGWVCKG